MRGIAKFRKWIALLKELGYDKEDRHWYSDFWWARHDDDGELLPAGVRRTSETPCKS